MQAKQKLFELGDSFSYNQRIMGAELFSYSDEELASCIASGGVQKTEALAELVKRHSRTFYRVAYRMLQNQGDAEDMVQQAFLKYWDQPQNWKKDKGVKFTTWFYRVVSNLCLDHLKKKRPVLLETLPELPVSESENEANLEANLQRENLERWTNELPERQRLALVLCFYEGLSHEEASSILGVTTQALRSLLMRAKETLKGKVQRSEEKL